LISRRLTGDPARLGDPGIIGSLQEGLDESAAAGGPVTISWGSGVVVIDTATVAQVASWTLQVVNEVLKLPETGGWPAYEPPTPQPYRLPAPY
jgi:hypothetical protein